MSNKGNKFGAFKGVFTPSILTILGVIMYLRLPWIVGQAGLWATLGIILVAHIISVSTGLSVASIATDKKVETGGTYYMISRSLGLPIGGTLGLALFVGLSFSVSLYLIGFSEILLTAFGIETTINNIRIAGVLSLIVVTIITFISTNLALKTQFVILAVLILSLVSVFMGKHEFGPASPIMETASNSLPWIALFAIFFPAVTGFEAGVSMSGDLKDPKKAIPIGIILAIIVGLVVYIGLVFFFSYTVERDLLVNDSSVLLNISFYSPLVVAGIWGATLSSAFGSILGAPRILQATAIDRITPKIFSKGVGKGNEPRNALMLTFLIALSGILIGELNVIARVVSIFFIITYGFLNLTCAIENWAGSDFRPSFRIPGWISIIGAIACFVVMIQLDIIAMIGAIVILGAIFFFLKRRELSLQSGDTWGGFWSSLVKYGLMKLSALSTRNQRNWRPNIILFSGNVKARPQLIDMGRTLVGKLGVFTNFELVESSNDDELFTAAVKANTELDHAGKKVITRRHTCSDIYEGMQMISRVYGFTGFEPNTILMGSPKKTQNPDKFFSTFNVLRKLDYNLLLYNYKPLINNSSQRQIDIWWNGNSRNLNFGLALLNYISTEQVWRGVRIRILVINYNTTKTDSIYALLNQMLNNSRLLGTVKVINNTIEKISERDIILSESVNADLTLLESFSRDYKTADQWFDYIKWAANLPCASMLLEAGSGFEQINASVIPLEKEKDAVSETEDDINFSDVIKLPEKELLADELEKIADKQQLLFAQFIDQSVNQKELLLKNFHKEVSAISSKVLSTLERAMDEENVAEKERLFSKAMSDLSFQTKKRVNIFQTEVIDSVHSTLKESLDEYMERNRTFIESITDKVWIKFNRSDFTIRKNDSPRIRMFKLRCKTRGMLLGWPINVKVELERASEQFLMNNRYITIKDYYKLLGFNTFQFLSNIKKAMIELHNGIELMINKLNTTTFAEAIQLQKEQSKELLDQTLKELIFSNRQAVLKLRNDLEQNIQRLSYVIDRPESSFLLRRFIKIQKRNAVDEKDLQELPMIWRNNIYLFVSKIHLEFIQISLRNRFKIKIRKQVDGLTERLDAKFTRTIVNLKAKLEEMKTSSKLPETDDVIEKFKDLQDLYFRESFEEFFDEISEIITDLPEKVEVNGENFFAQVDKGEFPESDTRIINYRQKANYYIGMELISKSRDLMEESSEILRDISIKLIDRLKLATFNLENLLHDEEGDTEKHGQLKTQLIDELLKEISDDELRVNVIQESFENNLDEYLKKSLEPLHSIIFTPSVYQESSRTKRRQKGKTFRSIGNQLNKLNRFFGKQMVNLLYSQSEGIMLAQRLSAFEREHKISNQAIQEMLVGFSPNPQIIKKLPFYYTSLFSGSTTINKDLWVGRQNELRQAEKIANRFKEGYSGALLITGGRNEGKTSLSKFIAQRFFVGYSVHVVKPPKGGSIKKDDFIEALQKALEITINPNFFLNSTPTERVIIINDLELWWERHEEGNGVVLEIVNLIKSLNSKVFFIVNAGTVAYGLMNKLNNLDAYFMGHIECEPMDAKELKELIMVRHRTGGIKFTLNGKNEDMLNQWNFAKLFNRYFNLTGGNPGFTMQAWLSNITKVMGKAIIIRNPTIPTTVYLNEISNDLWLVILQIAIHRRFNVERLSRILRQEESQSRVLIADLLRAGIIEERFPKVYALNASIETFLLEKLRDKGFI
jgi:amino acid transporter